MEPHSTVSRDEWLAARRALLAEEKAFTHARDELNRKRLALPWVKLDKTYTFDGLRVFVDQASLLYLDGAQVDFVETLEKSQRGFRIIAGARCVQNAVTIGVGFIFAAIPHEIHIFVNTGGLTNGNGRIRRAGYGATHNS